jgi:hypothetical protein
MIFPCADEDVDESALDVDVEVDVPIDNQKSPGSYVRNCPGFSSLL